VLGAAAPRASSHTEAFDLPTAEADRRVHDIIASNLGKPTGPAAHASAAKAGTAAVH
jgi:hypothetical protein